jgi:hypothetical protein
MVIKIDDLKILMNEIMNGDTTIEDIQPIYCLDGRPVGGFVC